MKELDTSPQSVEIPSDFVPWGAFAFLLSLIALCCLLWFSVYFMMIGRS